MINFTKRYINTVSLIISLIIFYFFNNYFFSIQKVDSKNILNSNQSQIQIEELETNKNNTKEKGKQNTAIQNSTKEQKNNKNKKDDWQIEIPKINLKAQIAEGTSKKIMDTYVGHFEETAKDTGNIGLAAHNRGYKVNYFQNLKKVKEGDEILYKYKGKQRKYVVKIHKIIKDTDWTLLENTKENKITLITCVENQPEYRRCVQAIEV